MTRQTNLRPGNVAVVFAFCLVTITGLVALILDGGLVLDTRRHAQSAADAAAISASDELFLNWATTKGADTADGKAANSARATALAMGYETGVNGCNVEVNIPPLNGQFKGVKGHAEVIITTLRERTFSRIWSKDQIKVGARAVARGRSSSIRNAILVLDPTDTKGALGANGGAMISVSGASVQVNSTNYSAMIANGNGTMSSPEFNVTGDPGFTVPGGGSFSGKINPNSDQIPDPLAYLPVPDPSTMVLQSKNKTSLSGNAGSTETLNPGVYKGGISISGQQNVVLNPGVYYMDGGGFGWTGGGTLTGNGVMIYNASTRTSDAISIAGNGNCTLSPPTSGTYQGVLLFQDRASLAPVTVSGTDSAYMNITGTFYAASANLQVTGNGSQQTLGSQYISYHLNVGGNGSFMVTWQEPLSPRVRDILLVE